jgi:hypothetical protein
VPFRVERFVPAPAREVSPVPLTIDSEPEAAISLRPMLGPQFALGWKHLVLCAWFGGLFLYLNHIPLFHSDIWGHVHYGRWMLEHWTIPAEDPFMPLAEGMRSINTAWLAQLIFALAESWGGPEALSTLYALTMLATYLVLARLFYLQVGPACRAATNATHRCRGSIRPTESTLIVRLALALAGTALVLALGWTRHGIVRPETFGGLCFALLLWLTLGADRQSAAAEAGRRGPAWWAAERPLLSLWIGIPLLFLAWANLHGSFAVGLLVLACLTIGQGLEAAWLGRSPQAALADPWFRRWLMLTEAAVAACLVNPYGVELLIETAQFSSNPNLRDVLEWFPLRLTDAEGIQFAAAWVLVLLAFRHSRRTVRPDEVLLLGALAAAVAPSVRMIGWFAPAVVAVLMPHVADILARWLPAPSPRSIEAAPQESLPPGRSYKLSLCAVLIVWICFALSPSSAGLLSATPRPAGQVYSQQTPVELTTWLREHPPQGLVWGPQWWGDWLAWDGPAGTRVFVTTHIHLVPRVVWQDYMRIVRAQPGWERALDRYAISDLVVHKELQPQLAAAVRRHREWKIAYEDKLGIVLRRAAAVAPPSDETAEESPKQAKTK